jgi:cytochrome oxidase Cu insertion factor (SCO1/SenC/PrrC family)
VRLIALEYGAHFRSNRVADEPRYTVDHSADTFVLDAQGRLNLVYGMHTPTEAIVREVRRVIRSSH